MNSYSPGQEIPCLYGTQSFIRTFTRAHNKILPWCSWIQPTSSLYFANIYFNIILPCIPTSSSWAHHLRFSNLDFVRIFHVPYLLHVLPISSSFVWTVQITKLQSSFSNLLIFPDISDYTSDTTLIVLNANRIWYLIRSPTYIQHSSTFLHW